MLGLRHPLVASSLPKLFLQGYSTQQLQQTVYWKLVCFTKYYEGDQIEDEMAGACSMDGRDENTYDILGGKLEGKNNLENLVVYGKITLEWILGKWGGRV
jgi:hypothetical protein